jgi:mono/diheme cytochrome c family protein
MKGQATKSTKGTKVLLLCIVCFLWLSFPHVSVAQNLPDILKRGEEVFSQSCTGYCHAVKGAGGGAAPRLAARGFDQAYINNIVTRGVPDTVMQGFAVTLSRTDFTAVVAYVASLNGITNPSITAPALGLGAAAVPDRAVPAEAASGRDLFYAATRSFGRCSTCHEVNGLGIPVAGPIVKAPANVQELRGLTTPLVSTVLMNGESMPALVISKGTRSVIFYDLTTPPPVLVAAEPSAVKISDGSPWRHASVMASYKDAELESILGFLKAALTAR